MGLQEEYEALAIEFAKLTPEQQAAQYERTQKIIAERREKSELRSTLLAYGIPTAFFGGLALAGAGGAAAGGAAGGAAAAETAGALSATELATLASAGFGIYKGITDQQMQEEALETQKEYLEAQTEALKARALVDAGLGDAGLIYVQQPQTGTAQQPVIYQTPAAKQVQDYMPLLIVAGILFLIFRKGKI